MALRLLLDTNALSDMFVGDAAVRQLLRACTVVCASPIVLAEIRNGALLDSRGRETKRYLELMGDLEAFLANADTRLVDVTERTSRVFASCLRALRRTPIPVHDAWIVAQCMEHDCVLVSRDAKHMGFAKRALRDKLQWINHRDM